MPAALPACGSARSVMRFTEICDKGKAAVIVSQTTVTDPEVKPLSTTRCPIAELAVELHTGPWLNQWIRWLAVVLRGVDKGIEFGRGAQQASLADPAASATSLAPIAPTEYRDDTPARPQCARSSRARFAPYRGV